MTGRGRSAAVGGDNHGIISTGDHAHISQHLPPPHITPMERVDALPGVINLPQRSALFVGREDDLLRTSEALSLSAGSVAVTVMHGLGGVGKSTLAAGYAEAHRAEYAVVWWMTADSPAAIDAGLTRLAVALQPALTEVSFEQQVEHGLRWLSTHTGWLLILDNVNEPADTAQLLARLPGGHVLITSRRATGWHSLAVSIDVDVLQPDHAVTMLTRMLRAEPDGAADLCARLGYLPLAIEQAGAYMAETGCCPAEYLDLLARHPAVMYRETAEGGDTQRTMDRIWRVTLDHLADTPLAGRVLRMIAWYAAEDIPVSLLADLATEPLLRKATGRLAAYGLITHGQGTLGVHRLVQAVTRTPDAEDPHRTPELIAQALGDATRALAEHHVPLDPEVPGDWPTWRALLPHVRAFADHADACTDTIGTILILWKTARFLTEHGLTEEAVRFLHRCTSSTERCLDPDHPASLSCRSALAAAYQAAGDFGLAIPLFEAAAAHSVQALGIDHPETLISRNNLACAYHSAGDVIRAISLHEAVVADRLRVLGPDHPHTMASQDSLACAYDAAGDLERAMPLHKEILGRRIRVLGEDHPQTLNSWNNLAMACQRAGELELAVSGLEAIAGLCVRVLGPDHPHALATCLNLAGAYRAAGDLAQAILWSEAVALDCLAVFGSEHPLSVAARINLGGVYRDAGALDLAIPVYEAALTVCLRALGPDHPHTLTAQNNLGAAYSSAGEDQRAVEHYQSSLAVAERVLGRDHPTTSSIRANLVGAQQDRH
jgi:tetratricopeptide (TPR) repeat protein